MKPLLVCFAIVITLITPELFASPHVPARYRFEDIIISVSNLSNDDPALNYQVTINGNGNSFYVKNNQERQALTINNDTLLELVNEFHTIHFFELKDNYGIKKEVKFKAPNTLTTVIRRLPQDNSKKICIKLRTFKKCLSIYNDQPVGAANLIKKIETLYIPKS